MKKNIFDQSLGYYDDDQQLNGFLSDITSSIRDAGRKVRSAVKKIAPAPLKKVIEGVEKVGKKLDQAGVTKVAAGLAIGWAAAPFVAAGASAIGGAVASAAPAVGSAIASGASTAFTTVKAGAVALAKSKTVATLANTAVSNLTGGGTTPEIETEAEAITRSYQAELNNAIAQTPAFAEVVTQARIDGYTDEEIFQHWLTSRAMYETAVPQIASTIQPQVYSAMQEQGFGPEFSQDYSYVEAERIASEAVTGVQQSASNSAMLPLLAAGAYFLFK